MAAYNPKNERIKREYFRHQKEACGKAQATIEAARKAISRLETYTGFKDFASFNKEQAIGFKKHLAKTRTMRDGQPLATSTMIATSNALKEFFRWLVCQPAYRTRLRATDIDYLNLSDNERRAVKESSFKVFPTLEQVRAVISAMPAETEVDMREQSRAGFRGRSSVHEITSGRGATPS